MTTARTPKAQERFRLAEPPPREPDEMTAYDHVYKPGSNRYLALHFGSPESTLVECERWIVASPDGNRARARRPDLLIAFGVSPESYRASNGYVISEQGKPPDFVLEVASVSTAALDTGEKREDYARLGIPEYWRFDETGEYHGVRLAGDSLIEGRYEPVPIEELPEGDLQGYSAVLSLYLRWEKGNLTWIDPATGRPVLTYEDQRARAADADARAAAERARAAAAEERVRELEAELARLRQRK